MEENNIVAAADPDLPEDDEHDSKERVLQRYFLQEWAVLKSMLDHIVANGGASEPSDVQKIRSIVDKYQEQGQLLEPYLETIVSPLMIIIRSTLAQTSDLTYEELKTITSLCIIVYSLVVVCGYKSVVKFFPHQVADLELAVSLLERCHHSTPSTSLRQESTGEMETKCVILLWLHILVLIPFDISSVDTSIAENIDITSDGPTPLVVRIIGFSKDYLSSAGPMRRIAALVLSRLLTRPDMTQAFNSFIEWSHEVILSATGNADTFRFLGVMEALSSIFKVGSKSILLTVADPTWNDTSTLIKSTYAARSSLLRKFIMKLSQRVGLACMPQRSASWRYEIRSTIFGKNISDATATNNSFNNVEHGKRSLQLEEDIDIPEIIEEIIELLLSGLRDSDTIVRWSAAKGIGRITACLTSSLSEDVLSSILELFTSGEGDGSWHGGCLALAELARRGLLLSSSLTRVVPVIMKALHYDIRRGPHSVGSHVRDAAAYVCWAFGRVYSNWDMKPILEQLAPHLLTIACYDREVNCRRAAAAAFQENVGRQGIFPHGIDIINTADYFTLASRTNSYLHVAVSIAQYKEYIYPFVEELMLHKISHWDRGLRELASVALSALSKYDPGYFGTYVLEKLLPCTLSQDLCMRHGATLAAGEIVLGLHQSQFTLSLEMQKSLSGVVPAIEKARLYRGKGGEIMRASVSRFIECISLARVRVAERTRQILLETLNENLRHPNGQIQEAAVNALKQFAAAYLVDFIDNFAEELTSKYLRLLKDPNPAVKRGSALAVGVLPYSHVAPRWRDVLPKLSNACLIQDNPEDNDAEARVCSVHSLVAVCETLTDERNSLKDNLQEESALVLHIKSEVMQTLFKALEDYAVDNRGDVGSWVREAAVSGLEKCAYILCRKGTESLSNIDITTISSDSYDCALSSSDAACYLFDCDLATNLIGGIAKQAVEKLDKMREISAKTLQRILHDQRCNAAVIPYKESLQEIIPNNGDLKWGVATVSYPRLVKLLQFPCYSKAVLSGLIISVGGLQDSLRKASLAALVDYIGSSNTETEGKENDREYVLSSGLLWILQQYQKLDRVIIPTLKTVEILFNNKLLLHQEECFRDFYTGLLNSLIIELKATKDFSKLYSGVSLLGYMTSVPGAVSQKAFSLLLSHLGHRYPKIRRAAADQVYLVILQNADLVSQDANDVALEILMETCWEGDIEEAKRQRSNLLATAGMEPGSNIAESKTLKQKKTNAASDENVSYSSLVGFSGF